MRHSKRRGRKKDNGVAAAVAVTGVTGRAGWSAKDEVTPASLRAGLEGMCSLLVYKAPTLNKLTFIKGNR
ncbi:hypothetical protein E2C01_065211 [Portunus trituberculatus]|uniref:Uncharacterized protein n=1 Tax=Portunus trituberculatus TaxID=210409 RepID=A0A5B7HMU3_PORTR|nr:hypothetical protein [Portunus trituberculatus]